jgi:hypothetical protein
MVERVNYAHSNPPSTQYTIKFATFDAQTGLSRSFSDANSRVAATSNVLIIF